MKILWRLKTWASKKIKQRLKNRWERIKSKRVESQSTCTLQISATQLSTTPTPAATLTAMEWHSTLITHKNTNLIKVSIIATLKSKRAKSSLNMWPKLTSEDDTKVQNWTAWDTAKVYSTTTRVESTLASGNKTKWTVKVCSTTPTTKSPMTESGKMTNCGEQELFIMKKSPNSTTPSIIETGTKPMNTG